MKEALYEAVMQDAERYEDPARRAEASEEDELARFFRELRDENRRRTEKARRLLAGRVAPERDEGRPRMDRSRLKARVGGS
jgi:hypothetical protein